MGDVAHEGVGSLDDLVRTHGPLSPRDAITLAGSLLDALATAHAQGIVHGGVNPCNVLLSPTGHVELGDAGPAHPAHPDDAYTAPEQRDGDTPRPESDMYSAGATLHFALEGRPPLPHVPHETPMRSAGPLPDLVMRMLVRSPEARPTAAGAASALRVAALTGTAGTGTVPAYGRDGQEADRTRQMQRLATALRAAAPAVPAYGRDRVEEMQRLASALRALEMRRRAEAAARAQMLRKSRPAPSPHPTRPAPPAVPPKSRRKPIRWLPGWLQPRP